MTEVRRFRHALAFLTRLPGGAHPESGSQITDCVPYFGVVGLVVGALGGGVFWGASELTTPAIAAVLALTATALATGGFHEDGLADTFDALAGGWDRDQRLRILKDSRHGTFGVLSLVLISLLKFAALSSLDAQAGALALVAAHSAGRAGAVGLMGIAPTAREDGLGADYTRQLPKRLAVLGVIVGVVVLGVTYAEWAPLFVVAIAVGVGLLAWWSHRKIGGVTGDILGAAEQIGEAVVLVLAASQLL